MRGYFFVYKRTLKSGKKVYYYQTYKPDGTLSSGKSTEGDIRGSEQIIQ